MSELLIKFNQLDEVQREEVLDFINFLLTKRQKKKEAVEGVEETYN